MSLQYSGLVRSFVNALGRFLVCAYGKPFFCEEPLAMFEDLRRTCGGVFPQTALIGQSSLKDLLQSVGSPGCPKRKNSLSQSGVQQHQTQRELISANCSWTRPCTPFPLST